MPNHNAAFNSGRVVEVRTSGGGPRRGASVYYIEDESGVRYRCEYIDLVTDGFRTLRVGDVVRFTPVVEFGVNAARNILKINEPSTHELYTSNTMPAVGDRI
jgi:hypothetical protein